MFQTITRLFFGGEEIAEEVKSGEVVEEEWLVVSHQEVGSLENQGGERDDTQPSSSGLQGVTAANMETAQSLVDPVPKDPSSSTTSEVITASNFHPKALLEGTPLTWAQKAKTWADRHHMTRNAIQRQNRVRQGVQHQPFHLQQPGHRNLCH
ncbi:uncharacterized protein V6R79_005840 [Siganus canaliculatus]